MTRGQDREAAILAAVHQLLGEVGYERLTIDAVAARARSSKATIYGRWPDKATLVAATIRDRSVGYDAPEYTGPSFLNDVSAFLRICLQMAETESLTTFTSILLAAADEPVLAEVVHHVALVPRQRDCDEIVRRALLRGEQVRPDAAPDLFDAVLGKILVRYVVEQRPFEPAEQEAFVGQVVKMLMIDSIGQ